MVGSVVAGSLVGGSVGCGPAVAEGGTGVREGRTRVLVGMIRVGIGVEVCDARGCTVRGVKVGTSDGVGLGVRVTEGVAEGRVDVTVGVLEAVGVGTVAVGNGPSREPAVRAMAVFVLLAFCSSSAFRGVRRKPKA